MASDRVSIQLYVDDQGSVQIRNVKKEIEDLGKTAESASSKLSANADTVANSFSAMAVGAAAASAAVVAGFKAGIGAIEEFNLKVISIGVGLTNIAAEGQGSFESMLKQNMAFAGVMYEKMREEDSKRFASLDDLMTGYNTLVQKGYAVRLDEVDALGTLVDKIKLATAGQNTQFQVMQELRGLLDGQVRAGSLLAAELRDRVGPEWEKQLDQHRQAGDLLQWIASFWPGIAAAAKEVENTIEAQYTTLQGNLKAVGREGLAGAYEYIVELLKEANWYLRNAQEITLNLEKSWVSLKSIIQSAFDPRDLEFFSRLIERTSRGIAYLTQMFRSLGEIIKGLSSWTWLGPDFDAIKEGFGNAIKGMQDFRSQMETGDTSVKFKMYERTGAIVGYGSEGFEQVDQTKPKGATSFTGGMYEGMNKVYMERFRAMNEEFKKITGRDIHVTDAFRTFQQQVDARKNKGLWAATPGTSLHEKGLAMDVNVKDLKILKEKGMLGLYGFHLPLEKRAVRPEPWHMEMIDYAKRDKDAASASKKAESEAAKQARLAEQAQKKIEGLSDTLEKETARSTGSSMDQINQWAKDYAKRIDEVQASEEEKAKARELLEKAKQGKIQKLEDEYAKWKTDRNKDDLTSLDVQHAEALKKYAGLGKSKEEIDEIFYRKRRSLEISAENEKLGLAQTALQSLEGVTSSLQDQATIQKQLVLLEDKRNANALEMLVLQGKISQEEFGQLRSVQRISTRERMRQAGEVTGGFGAGAGAWARERALAGQRAGFDRGRSALDAGERMLVDTLKDLTSSLTKSLFGKGEKFDPAEFAAQLGELIVNTLLNVFVETLVSSAMTALAQFIIGTTGMTLANVGLTAAGATLSAAGGELIAAATMMMATSVKESIPIIGHTGLIVAHSGHNLASDERYVKAQVGEWILNKRAVSSLTQQGVSFGALNNGKIPATGGGTVVNHTYAPTITRRMSQSDYNQDARKMWRAHDRERKRRGA